VRTAYVIYDIPQGKPPVKRETEFPDLAEAMSHVLDHWRGFIIRQDETERCVTREVVARSEGRP
jgi:hypothetical protein